MKLDIELVFVAYNRLEYTRMTLASLLADPTEDFSLTIWDNGSKDGTAEFLAEAKDARIRERIFSKQNVYITGAANECFTRSKADLVGIIPDDFWLTPGWTRPLAEAHADVPEFGFVGCWHAGQEFFDGKRAAHKIQTFGRHKILRHPFTGGGAGLVKLKSWKECGPFDGISTPPCWIRMALKGYVNGFYVPPIFVEHMDYPWSKHHIRKGNLISEIRRRRGLSNEADIIRHHQWTVRALLDGPWDVKYYVGWRDKLRKLRFKVRWKLARLLAPK